MATIPSWIQSALFEANVIEVTLSLGIISAPDHIQVQVETRDPIGGQLLDMWSMPHASIEDLPAVLREATAMIAEHVRRNVVLSSDHDTVVKGISDAAPPRD